MLSSVGKTLFAGAVVALGCLASAPVWAHGSGTKPPDQGTTRGVPVPPTSGSFVNFETPHVYPIDISPDGATLAACNTPDGRVEIYDINQTTGQLTHIDSVSVGYDPVSVRFRTNGELWAVNHISDSISVVDVATGIVTATIDTDDEPADVVFYQDSGNSDPLAAVSCSRPDLIQIFHATTHALVDEFVLKSEDPRALVTDGTNVYVAPFASGNSTTIIPNNTIGDALQDGTGPYGGQNPPFNNAQDVGFPGDAWVTPLGSDNFGTIFAPPPQVSLIVRKDGGGAWRDDNGADWTDWISGAKSFMSLRVVGWDLTDNDIASFSTSNGTSTLNGGFGTSGWVTRQMTTGMALAQNPNDGRVMLVGTEATNEIRFEPNIEGTFTRVMVAVVDGSTGAQVALVDMNIEHLDAAQSGVGTAYEDGHVLQAERDKSIGDPRGVAINAAGSRAYITGMGSGNVVVIDPATGARLGGTGYTIDLGSPTPGPTGIVLHPSLGTAYVVNRFASSVMTIDVSGAVGTETLAQTLPFFDPTPDFINDGRDDFYDTHQNSGLGQISCASCHIDGRTDQLAWDLGNPQGGLKTTNQVNPANPGPGEHNLLYAVALATADDFHDMKGPMTTQTLIDIIGKEPHHWRGDRDGIEEFAGAFQGLQGDDSPLLSGPMQQFENFLSSLHFGPNPFRALDNSLPGGPKFIGAGDNPNLPLDGYFSNGPNGNNPGLSARGTALPSGDAFRGFQLYVQGNPLHLNPTPGHDTIQALDNVFQCVSCHALPHGKGSIESPVFDFDAFQFNFTPIAPGPLGERHTGLFTQDGTGNTDGTTGSVNQGSFTVAQLRNQLDKHGFNQKLATESTLGFGVLHDGSVDDLDTFLGSAAFDVDNDQDLADLISFVLCVNGDDFDELAALPGAPTFESSDLPINMNTVGQLGPEGGEVNTAHAAVGKQVTINSSSPGANQLSLINLFIALSSNNKVDLIVKGAQDGNRRGWVHKDGILFHSDENVTKAISLNNLLALAGAGTEMTFTVVPRGLGTRMGIDRDEDGSYDHTEFLNGTDASDPQSGFPSTPASTPWGLIALSAGLALLTAAYGMRRALAKRRA